MKLLKTFLILITGISILQGAAVENNFESILKTINNLTPNDRAHCIKYLFLETQYTRKRNINHPELMTVLGLIGDRECRNQLNSMDRVDILELAKKIHESLDEETKKNFAARDIVFFDEQQPDINLINALSMEDKINCVNHIFYYCRWYRIASSDAFGIGIAEHENDMNNLANEAWKAITDKPFKMEFMNGDIPHIDLIKLAERIYDTIDEATKKERRISDPRTI